MGDRGNICVRDDDGDVWFYTHWSGSGLKAVVQRALAKRWRWSDPPYLARIIFDELTVDQHGEEAGFGIAAKPQDKEHPYLIVDCRDNTVYEEDGILERTTFEQFIKRKLK